MAVATKIPYGETRYYQQQAQQLNRLTAVRAIANANGRNQHPLLSLATVLLVRMAA